MTWSLNASGHARSKEDELKLIQNLSEEIGGGWSGCTTASLSTQHYGVVALLDAGAVKALSDKDTSKGKGTGSDADKDTGKP